MTKETQQGYRHVDLPVDLLEKSGGWVPPKSQDSEEIEELRVLPPGSVIARRQETGVNVAGKMLEFMSSRDISNFGPRILAAAGFNTAWHNHAEGVEDVTRRRLWLPVHQDAGEVTRASLVGEAQTDYEEAAEFARLLRVSVERRSAAIPPFKKKLGRKIGNASLVLASVPYARSIDRAWDDVEKQDLARRGAMQARVDAREMRTDLGVYPSIAQLSDRFGPLPVHIQHSDDSVLKEALDYGQTTVFEAAA